MPEELYDSVLGEVKYNEDMEWWEGQIVVGEDQVELSVWAEANLASHPAELASLQANLERLKTQEDMVRRSTAERMVDLAEHWRDEEEDLHPVTIESFQRRISLNSVELSTERITLYYDDGDLFAGHVILVRLDTNMQIQNTDIAG